MLIWCSMFTLSSGRSGNFDELGLAANDEEVAAIATAGCTPVEVFMPDGSSGERAKCDVVPKIAGLWALLGRLRIVGAQRLPLPPARAAAVSPGPPANTPVCPLPSAVLLSCSERDGPKQVVAALRERLGAAAAAETAVLAADVDALEDVAAMREMLRQAQAALRRRQL